MMKEKAMSRVLGSRFEVQGSSIHKLIVPELEHHHARENGGMVRSHRAVLIPEVGERLPVKVLLEQSAAKKDLVANRFKFRAEPLGGRREPAALRLGEHVIGKIPPHRFLPN